MNLADLRRMLEHNWDQATIQPEKEYNPLWPSRGQCASTAVMIWLMWGGKLVSTRFNGQSHWFNRLEWEGVEYDVDLTGDQFGFEAIQILPAGKLYDEVRQRTITEADRDTISRACILQGRITKLDLGAI